ncbi:MAG: PaaI family thioesterase [Acidobacteria bacterium]|nr:PaaI family thioesterase [Acidobacteriota bacterium]MDA1234746.1 PaaI family thioesterase [Acidobacteriota bacterium]
MHFHELLALRLVEDHEDGVTVELPLREEFSNSDGYLHGGVTAALIDGSLGVAIQRRYGPERRGTTTEMKVNFLRPAHQGVLTARARIIKAGRTLVVGEVNVFDQERRHIAVGLLTYMLI